MKTKTILLLLILFTSIMFTNCSEEDSNGAQNSTSTVTDIDGNVYHTIKIGNQTWMVENLRTTHYNDGTEIPNVLYQEDWSSLSTGAYCNYDNAKSYASVYGRLYNWYSVNTGKLAPEGWRVPTDDDFTELVLYCGGSDVAASKLRETGTEHWENDAEGITNESGFSARGAGYRRGETPFGAGIFDLIKVRTYFWTTTEFESVYSWYFVSSRIDIFRGEETDKKQGYSVRCIKDKNN